MKKNFSSSLERLIESWMFLLSQIGPSQLASVDALRCWIKGSNLWNTESKAQFNRLHSKESHTCWWCMRFHGISLTFPLWLSSRNACSVQETFQGVLHLLLPLKEVRNIMKTGSTFKLRNLSQTPGRNFCLFLEIMWVKWDRFWSVSLITKAFLRSIFSW